LAGSKGTQQAAKRRKEMEPMTNGRVSDLELKHRTLNEQVDRFARRAYLTPQEQKVYAAMKKEKLLTRDLLMQMRRG
jgi:hypothetical protein